MTVKERGWRKCHGPCGRTMALYRFRRSDAVHCDECHGIIERDRFRERYRTDAAFREKHKAAQRTRYANDAELRERKKAAVRAHYMRLKIAWIGGGKNGRPKKEHVVCPAVSVLSSTPQLIPLIPRFQGAEIMTTKP